MMMLSEALEPERHEEALWITHRSAQSESMLADRRVLWVPEVHARQWQQVLRRTPEVLSGMRAHCVDTVYSTGAALALSGLPLARLAGVRPVYIDSLARSQGPSLTGRVMSVFPWVPVYTQYPMNAGGRWRFRYSLLDRFQAHQVGSGELPGRVFVTLGTTRPWQFRRLVDRVLGIVPSGVQIRFQTGVTDVSDLDTAMPNGSSPPPHFSDMMTDLEFQSEIEAADVVVTHSGVGSFIRCLSLGKVPIMVPRRAKYGEHVDDHQQQIATVASERGLALMREVEDLTFEDLRAAMSFRVHPKTSA